MDKYTIYCTAEQTKKAFELGAPIKKEPSSLQLYGCVCLEEKDSITGTPYWLMPVTAEQMIGWLEKNTLFKCIQVNIDANPTNWMYAIYYGKDNCIALDRFSSRKDATLAAIDAALDYLIHYKNDE